MRFTLTIDWSGKPSDVGQVSVVGDVEDVYADARFGPPKKLVREFGLEELGQRILADASNEPRGWRVAYVTGVNLPPEHRVFADSLPVWEGPIWC